MKARRDQKEKENQQIEVVLLLSYLIVVDLLLREASGVGVLGSCSSANSGCSDKIVMKDDNIRLFVKPFLGFSHVLGSVHVHSLGGGYSDVVLVEHIMDGAESRATHGIRAGDLSGGGGQVLHIFRCVRGKGGRKAGK